jgi:DNA helicase-2/ATP-dependent DNA helicase PcrA
LVVVKSCPVPKGHKLISPTPPSAMSESSPHDCRDAIHWFIDNAGLYIGSTRGVFATDFSEEQEAVLEAAIINLKARNVHPVVLSGETLYQQADQLWKSSLEQASFGRPVASKLELEISGSEFVIVKDLEAPETAHHLWYLFHHLFYPRALFNKPLLVTSPLGYDEFVTYGAGCDDLEFAGRKVTWEKLLWTLNASTMDLPHFHKLKADGITPMLKAEYALFKALKERGLEVVPQHVIGDYMLDFALFEKQNKINIEVDVFATIDHNKPSSQEVKRNLQLLNDGWKIVRFSTAEILSSVSSCVDAVEEVWQQGRKKSASGRVVSGTQPTAVADLPVDDDSQRFAITHGAGPAAVEGGAGTGKSSCVVHRAAYLLAQGIAPEKILVITHSNDCVKQLKSALEACADRTLAQRVPFYCWHDLGFKLLKENLSAIKRKPPVKVEPNPQKVLKRLLDKSKKDLDPTILELSEELDEFTLSSLVSLYKANLVSPRHLKERAKTEIDELVARVFQAYEDQLQKANRIDRDDMVSLAAQLLVDDVDVRTKHQYQYEFILVDEYQDATAAGDLLARLLAFPQDNVYLVGNEDESIYETKGSLPRLMSEVSIRLPNARCYMLEKNWRSHPVIVDHAKQLLHGLRRRRIQKDMISGWGAAPTTAIIGPQILDNETAEAEWVGDEIGILIDSGRTAEEIAVIYHEHRYATLLEEAITRRGIRCITTNSQSALLPDEAGDVMAFLTLVMDPDGPKARESFERICHLRVKEVNPALSATIASFAESNNLSYLKGIEIYWQAVQDPSCRELEQLVRIIRTMHQEKLPPAETISLLKRTQRLSEYYNSIKVPPGVVYEPMRKLGLLEEEARKFQSVTEFVKSQQAIQQAASGQGATDKAVHVLNIHETKGREFPVAFVVGLAEGVLPNFSADVEEERRLFYVAFTRAKELVYLSYPTSITGEALGPSHFLVDARLILPAAVRPAAATTGPVQSVAASASAPTPAAANASAAQPPGSAAASVGSPALASAGNAVSSPAIPSSAKPNQMPIAASPGANPAVNPAANRTNVTPAAAGAGQTNFAPAQAKPAQAPQPQQVNPALNASAPAPQAQRPQVPQSMQPAASGANSASAQMQGNRGVASQMPQQPGQVGQANQLSQQGQVVQPAKQTSAPQPGITQPARQPGGPQTNPNFNSSPMGNQGVPGAGTAGAPAAPNMVSQASPAGVPGPAPQATQAAQTVQVSQNAMAPGSVGGQQQAGQPQNRAQMQSNSQAAAPGGPMTGQPQMAPAVSVTSQDLARAPQRPANGAPPNTIPPFAAQPGVPHAGAVPKAIIPAGPEAYPSQPISRAPGRDTAALNVSNLPSPEELQAKIVAEAAKLQESQIDKRAGDRRPLPQDNAAGTAGRVMPGNPAVRQAGSMNVAMPVSSSEQSALLDGLFGVGTAPANQPSAVEASSDVDFPSTGPTRTSADLAPPTVKRTGTQNAIPERKVEVDDVPEELVRGFQSAIAQSTAQGQQPAAQQMAGQESMQQAAPAPQAAQHPQPQPPLPQQVQQSMSVQPVQPVQQPMQQSMQPMQQPVPPAAAQPFHPMAALQPVEEVEEPAQPRTWASSWEQSANPGVAAHGLGAEQHVQQQPMQAAQPSHPTQSMQSMPAHQQQPQPLREPAHDSRPGSQPLHPMGYHDRSIPVTPPSVFEPPPEVIAVHANEVPLGELNLDQRSEPLDPAAVPPPRTHLHKGVAGVHDDSDIADLLELAAKAPSKKAKGKGKVKSQEANPESDEPVAATRPSQSEQPLDESAYGVPQFGGIQTGQPSQYQSSSMPQMQQPPGQEQSTRQPMQQQPMQPEQMQPPQQAPAAQGSGAYQQMQASQQPQQQQAQVPWGEQVRQLQQGNQVYKPPDVPDHLPRCPHCYVPLEGGSRFCGECGYTLPERIPMCQNCSSPLEPGAKFCGECGARQVPTQANGPAPRTIAAQMGVTPDQLSGVPYEALATRDGFKQWLSAINPQRQQAWMIKLLKMLEQ